MLKIPSKIREIIYSSNDESFQGQKSTVFYFLQKNFFYFIICTLSYPNKKKNDFENSKNFRPPLGQLFKVPKMPLKLLYNLCLKMILILHIVIYLIFLQYEEIELRMTK